MTCVPVNEEMLGPRMTVGFEDGMCRLSCPKNSLLICQGLTDGTEADHLQHAASSQSVRTQLGIQSGQSSKEVASYTGPILPRSPRDVLQSEIFPDFDNLDPQIHGHTQDEMEIFPSDTFAAGLPSADSHPHESFIPNAIPLGDFLADIMMSVSPAQLDMGPFGDKTADILMRDVFDFGIEEEFDLNSIDFQLLSQPIIPGSPTRQHATSDESNCPPSRTEYGNGPGVDPVSVEAFQKSLWRWTPGQTDQGHCEQINLSLPYYVGAPSAYTVRPCEEALNQLARDRMLAMVLNTCEREAVPRIVTSFPSAELLDYLMQEYLFLHDQEPDPFIHIPTFQPQSMRAELVASTVFFGAVRSPVPLVRKLGFALQESVRLALPKAVGAPPP